jgi:hypothetical protein
MRKTRAKQAITKVDLAFMLRPPLNEFKNEFQKNYFG